MLIYHQIVHQLKNIHVVADVLGAARGPNVRTPLAQLKDTLYKTAQFTKTVIDLSRRAIGQKSVNDLSPPFSHVFKTKTTPITNICNSNMRVQVTTLSDGHK